MGGPLGGLPFSLMAKRCAAAAWQDPKPEAGERTIAQALRGAKMERDGKKSSHFGGYENDRKAFRKKQTFEWDLFSYKNRI